MKHEGFLRSYRINLPEAAEQKQYPYTIPAVRCATEVALDPRITFFVGENGTGKSTLIEALAINAGFNPEGGSKSFAFATNRTESALHEVMQVIRNPRRERTGFFLRAESFYNVATNIDDLDKEPAGGPKVIDSYGGKSLHHQSHGESFMSLVVHRFRGNGLYILDEPEAALSPTRQLALLSNIHQLVREGAQFIIATHSPILLAYPGATIYELSNQGIERVEYEKTTHYTLTRDFLNNLEVYKRELFPDN